MNTIPEKYHNDLAKVIETIRLVFTIGKELPTAVILGKFGCGTIPIVMHTLSRDKEKAAFILRGIAAELKPDYIILVSEAWMVSKPEIPKEEFEKLVKDGIENHPDKEEIVFVTLETTAGFWYGQSRIKTVDGQRMFDDLQFKLQNGIEGRFSTFLPREDTLH